MGLVKERLMLVERQGKEQGIMIDGLKEAVANLKSDMDRRFDSLDAKLSKQFMWLAGMQTMTLLAVVAALAAMLTAITT
jgi:uncharacterized coiled-coil protein SlyX